MSAAVHPVPEGFRASIGPDELAELHRRADQEPEAFWLDQAKRLDWSLFPTQAGDWSFEEASFGIRWYADGELNLSVNCLDRHLSERGDRIALIFEPDEPGTGRTITYRELHAETCRMANLLKSPAAITSRSSIVKAISDNKLSRSEHPLSFMHLSYRFEPIN